MSELLNVDLRFAATGVDNDPAAFRAEMDIRYYNMGRAAFAGLESELMSMFKGLADMQKAQIDGTDSAQIPNGTIR